NQGVCDTGRRRLGRQAWQASGLVARSRSRVVGRSADVTRPDGRLLAQTEAELGSQRRRRRRGCGVVGLANCRKMSAPKQLVYWALVDGRDAPVGREPCTQAVANLNRVHSNPSSAVVPRTQHVPVARRRHWTLGWSRETFGWSRLSGSALEAADCPTRVWVIADALPPPTLTTNSGAERDPARLTGRTPYECSGNDPLSQTQWVRR